MPAHSPPIRSNAALLDEWLAGLNQTELKVGITLIERLRGYGCTIIIVEHVMDAIRSLRDRCIVMSSGDAGPGAQHQRQLVGGLERVGCDLFAAHDQNLVGSNQPGHSSTLAVGW